MVDAHLRSKTIETADIKNLIIGGQTGIDGIRFCLAAVTNGENLADPAFSWFLQYKNKNGQGESVGLTPVYENGLVKLPWVPNKLATQVPGRMQIQLYAAIVTGEGEAAVVDKQWVSEFAIIYIQENINPDPIVATEPSVIEYYVTLYAAYKNAAEAAAAAALESEQAAALSEGNAADSEAAALASKQAAGQSEQAAALAAGSALESKNSIDATFTDPGLVAVRTDMATPETSKIQKVAANEANITEVADDLNLGSSSKIKKVADDIAKVGAVADGMTHVTAVEAKLTDIAKVAAIEVAVPKVAAIDGDVAKVAAIDEAVGLVAGVKDDVTAVALIDEEISAIALIKDQIVSLEAEKLKVSAVEAKLAEIQGVYAKLQAIEGLYGKSTEIDELYAQLGVIAAKANQSDFDAVEARVDASELAIAQHGQDLASVKQTLQQGNGVTLDYTGIGSVNLDARATGRANITIKGKTITNLASNGDFSQGDTLYSTTYNQVMSVAGKKLVAFGEATQTGGKQDRINLMKLGSTYRILVNAARVAEGTTPVSFGVWNDSNSTYIELAVLTQGVHSITFTKSINAFQYLYFRCIAGVFDTEIVWYQLIDITKEDSIKFPARIRSTSNDGLVSSVLYIANTSNLRSVPATTDEVKLKNGELMKVQNIQRYTLQSENITSVHTSMTNLDWAIIQIPSDSIVLSTVICRATVIDSPWASGTTLSIENDSTASIGKITAHDTLAKKIGIGVLKGTTLATAKATLAGKVIYYQLATPVITPLLNSGILQAKSKGTVYFEPYYEDSHQTDANSQITMPYTGTIDKITGYDENLQPYKVPSTEYTLIGTLLTITGAEENEVFYVEMSRSESLAPDMTVNTLNNEQVIADTNNGKYYKLVPTITNGVLVGQNPIEVV